jgi:hypothetical protein
MIPRIVESTPPRPRRRNRGDTLGHGIAVVVDGDAVGHEAGSKSVV